MFTNVEELNKLRPILNNALKVSVESEYNIPSNQLQFDNLGYKYITTVTSKECGTNMRQLSVVVTNQQSRQLGDPKLWGWLKPEESVTILSFVQIVGGEINTDFTPIIDNALIQLVKLVIGEFDTIGLSQIEGLSHEAGTGANIAWVTVKIDDEVYFRQMERSSMGAIPVGHYGAVIHGAAVALVMHPLNRLVPIKEHKGDWSGIFPGNGE